MTSKELTYIEDTLKAEQQVIKKYQTYSNVVSDSSVKDLFSQALKKHQTHYKMLLDNLNA